MQTLRRSSEWKDAVIPALRKRGIAVDDSTLDSPPEEILGSTIFSVLRSLHASQAEKLMSMTWRDPMKGENHLLEDSVLRDYYGPRIGRIAHSHHWDIGRLTKEFSTVVTPVVGLPSNWVLNEVKVACMLRCADAAHIDARRAPRMLYAIKSPQGASDEHWRFQTKIGQLVVRNNRILYSSSAFDQSEAGAWWLAFDIANMINNELQGSQMVLEESSTPQFEAGGVEGVQSPRLFSKQLPVDGWEPVNAEVRVSDPIHLALTLGGKNLYNQGYRAPVRELLQNAVDAIKGRRGDRSAEEFPGSIRISLEKGVSPTGSDEVWFHIDDNGMGMTQRVLTGPLIDFGKSIWTSTLMAEEYPSLRSTSTRPIGKFGIGFFSTFLLGREVRVVSKRYDAGVTDARVLEFSSLNNRPILRKCRPSELPDEFSTRVSVKLEDIGHAQSQSDKPESSGIFQYAIHLCSALDINVLVMDNLKQRSHKHSFDWLAVHSDYFIDEVMAFMSDESRVAVKRAYSHLLRPITHEGKTYGRAALNLGDDRRSEHIGFITVEGILYPSFTIHDYLDRRNYPPRGGTKFVGVMTGSTDKATRDSAVAEIPADAFKSWLTEQASLIDPRTHETLSLIPISHFVIANGAQSGHLPFCYSGSEFISAKQAADRIGKNSKIHLLLEKNYKDGLRWMAMKGLGATFLRIK
jgi:hypothetical protein